jgi:hypothetical protein
VDPKVAAATIGARVVLYPFLASLALVIAATAYTVVRGVSLYRLGKQVGGAFEAELALFDERAARTERLLAEADASGQALVAARERLRVSHARLQVLLGALEAARRRTRWMRFFLPLR